MLVSCTFTTAAPSLRGFYGPEGERQLRRLAPKLPKRRPDDMVFTKATASSLWLPYNSTARKAVLARRREKRAEKDVSFVPYDPPMRTSRSRFRRRAQQQEQQEQCQTEVRAGDEENEETLGWEYDTEALSMWAMGSICSLPDASLKSFSSSLRSQAPTQTQTPPRPASAPARHTRALSPRRVAPSLTMAATGARSMWLAQEQHARAVKHEALRQRKAQLLSQRARLTHAANVARLEAAKRLEEQHWRKEERERERERQNRLNVPGDLHFRNALE